MNLRSLLALLFVHACLAHAGASRADDAQTPPTAAIASAHRLASEAGHEILAAGGNAFDAAVAISAALGVVEPSSSGLGGGGFWLLHRASDGMQVMIDAREVAPTATRPEQYLDEKGELIREKSVNGPLSAAIPGQPAGLVHLAATFGNLPLSRSLAPAIRLAKEGFPFAARLKLLMGTRLEVLRRYPETARIFLVDGAMPADGALIRQPDLAATLEQLAKHGAKGYYEGAVARRLVDGVRAAGGTWSLEDLARYRIKEREPIRFEYRGYQIVTAPPPSSGGVALATILNVLSGYELDKLGRGPRLHLIVEAMRRAYRDRSYILGDPDFVDMPVTTLISPQYAAGLRAGIRLDRATPSAALPGQEAPAIGADTSHFSVIDRAGNMVAGTVTINLPFGCGFIAPGTGVVLNNEMDDFALKAGVPNAYGLIGTDANAVKPGKRMLSSMTPTFAIGTDRIAVIGTPGGSRIPTMVLFAVLEFIGGGHPQDFVATRRIHHQYLPDVISAEAGALVAEEVAGLQALGHTVSDGEREWGNMNAVVWDKEGKRMEGGSDPRGLVGKAIIR